jgi:hypothetical protein
MHVQLIVGDTEFQKVVFGEWSRIIHDDSWRHRQKTHSSFFARDLLKKRDERDGESSRSEVRSFRNVEP